MPDLKHRTTGLRLPAALILAVAVSCAFGACGDPSSEHGSPHTGHADTHGHGPHGGQIAEIGDHEAHLEVLLDHGARKLVAYVLTEENKPLRIVAAPVLTLTFESGPVTIIGVGVGSTDAGTSEWHFRGEALAGEPKGGSVALTLGDKAYTVTFSHDDDHDAGDDHDDHGHDDDDHDDHGHDDDDDDDHDDHGDDGDK